MNSSVSVSRYTVCLLGFSAAEKASVETFCRFAARRTSSWTVSDLAGQATGVLIKAANAHEYGLFRAMTRPEQALALVGSSDLGTGCKLLAEPLRLSDVLSVFDYFVRTSAVRGQVGAVGVGVTASPVTPVDLNKARGFAAPITGFERSRQSPPEAVGTAKMRQVLLVDDSDVALKFMQNRMQHFGYNSQLVRSGEEALAMVSRQDFQFVFLDVSMAGLDGYQTCRAIKQNKARKGAIPVVIMLTSRGGTIDKIRGTMAGCDAYLTKPLNEKQLAAVLSKYNPSGNVGALALTDSNLDAPISSFQLRTF